ncbi:MAG: sulfite exporter TauE/SafE family protein [Firmicutes bacterium]|nr:sulfite exporter TauE/SafE family protein [Bacillota bacterium]
MVVPVSLVALVGAVGAGFAGALLGLGGGIFIVPFATLVLGYDVHHAIGASIVSVIATSCGAAATYVAGDVANVRIGSFLELATTTGALAGAVLASRASSRVLTLLFAGLLLYSAYTMFRARRAELPEGVRPHPLAERLKLNGCYYDRSLGRDVSYNVANVPHGFGVMWVAGLTSGLLGIGSGLLKVLGMDLFMKLPLKVSTATSNLMIGVTAAASAGYYFAHGLIDPALAGPVAIGVFGGARLGAWAMARLRSRTLRLIFVPVLVYVAVQMLMRGMGG